MRKSVARTAKYSSTPLNAGIASRWRRRRFAPTSPDRVSPGNHDGGDGVQDRIEADLPAAPGAAAISVRSLG
jgi:hypothetical protein